MTDAQITKLARIAAKLRLQPHDKILDIGCGWGGLTFALASVEPGASVTGITLSENQHAYAKTGVEPTPQAKHIHYELRDYRHQTGQFDKIVSVGMLEHVGAAHLPCYFVSIARLLSPDGLALVHSIGVSGAPRRFTDGSTNISSPAGICRARKSNSRRQPERLENAGYRNFERSLRRNAQTLAPRIFCKYCHGTPSL